MLVLIIVILILKFQLCISVRWLSQKRVNNDFCKMEQLKLFFGDYLDSDQMQHVTKQIISQDL